MCGGRNVYSCHSHEIIIAVHIWGGTVNSRHLSSTRKKEKISFGSGNPWTKTYWLQRETFENEHVFLPWAYQKMGYMYLSFELESLLACHNINYYLMADKKQGTHRLFANLLFNPVHILPFSFQLWNHFHCPVLLQFFMLLPIRKDVSDVPFLFF